MSGRFAALTPPALLALCVILFASGVADAHRLNAQAFLLPNRQVQIEGWFSTGEDAKGANVEVRTPTKALVASGQLNDKGVFVFSYPAAEPLTVVIAAGGGHRAEVALTAQELAQAAPQREESGPTSIIKTDNPASPNPIGNHEDGVPFKDMLVGISFVLALAAFVLSCRNSRKWRKLKS